VRIFLYKRILEGKYKVDVTSKEKEDKSINKKYFSALKKSIENFEQFSDCFPIAKPILYIILGLMAQIYPDTRTKVQDGRDIMMTGLNEAIARNMDYYVAVIHHWIGTTHGINDPPDIVKRNLIHQDKAFNLFLDFHVNESMLLWHQ